MTALEKFKKAVVTFNRNKFTYLPKEEKTFDDITQLGYVICRYCEAGGKIPKSYDFVDYIVKNKDCCAAYFYSVEIVREKIPAIHQMMLLMSLRPVERDLYCNEDDHSYIQMYFRDIEKIHELSHETGW
jgi:hypothetical protein